MVDKISKERRSQNMSAIRSKDMKPEMVVRRLVHGLGYRYRLHRKDLPGKPDLVFGPRKKVLFVHGCFWHQHSIETCKDGRLPKSNTDYWTSKLQRNVERDKENERRIRDIGWESLVIWECELGDMPKLERIISKFLSG